MYRSGKQVDVADEGVIVSIFSGAAFGILKIPLNQQGLIRSHPLQTSFAGKTLAGSFQSSVQKARPNSGTIFEILRIALAR